MTPEIIDRDEFIVVGIRTLLDAAAQTTGTLWKDQFLPRHNEVKGAEHIYYGVFNSLPDDAKGGRYEYVAGVPATLEDIPVGMVGWVIPAGRYAEADAAGLAGIAQVCRELITEWLPDSGYKLVPSPMFAYTRDKQPDSASAVWKVNIPVETPEVLEQLQKWLV